MDDVSSYYNTLNDVAQGNMNQFQKAKLGVEEKGERVKELMLNLGAPLADEGITGGTKALVRKGFKTASRIARGEAEKVMNKVGLKADDLENFINEARKGNFKTPELKELYEGQKSKLEGFLSRMKRGNFNKENVVGDSSIPKGNVLPSQRIEKQPESVKLDGDEEIARMSKEDEGAENLYNFRRKYLKKQFNKLTDEEKGNVNQAVEDARARGDYLSSNQDLDNAEKAKNLKIRRDAINEQLDNRDVQLISHQQRPTELSIDGNNKVSEDPIKSQKEGFTKDLSDIKEDNRVVNFDTLQQDIRAGRGASSTRIANKNVNLQKREFMDNASDLQKKAYNDAEKKAFNEIDLLGKTDPETAMAKLQAQQNLIHQSISGEKTLNAGDTLQGLRDKVGGLTDGLNDAKSSIENTTGDLQESIGSSIQRIKGRYGGVLEDTNETVENSGKRFGKALLKGGEAMAETDAEAGGPEDVIGDAISAVVGIGTIIGGLFKKEKEPSLPIPTSTSIQLGGGGL